MAPEQIGFIQESALLDIDQRFLDIMTCVPREIKNNFLSDSSRKAE
jgi:hypothetical protein